MSENFEDIADEWIEGEYPEADFLDSDSSALTWDEETVREAHREIALRSSRASGRRLF